METYMEFAPSESPENILPYCQVGICKIQALWRGALTRKRMCDIRQSYTDIFQSLEPQSDTQLVWNSSIPCKPNHIPTAEFQKRIQARQVMAVTQESNKVTKTVRDTEAILGPDVLSRTSPGSDVPTGNYPVQMNILEQDTVSNSIHCETQHSHKLCEDNAVQTDLDFIPLYTRSSETLDVATSIPNFDETVISNEHNALRSSNSSNIEHSPYPSTETVPHGHPHTDLNETYPFNRENSSLHVHSTSSRKPDNYMSPLERSSLDLSSNQKMPQDVNESLKDQTAEELQAQKNLIAMELLWIQQAIDSRKQYLELRTKIAVK